MSTVFLIGTEQMALPDGSMYREINCGKKLYVLKKQLYLKSLMKNLFKETLSFKMSTQICPTAMDP